MSVLIKSGDGVNAFLQYLSQVEGYDVTPSRHEFMHYGMVNVKRIFPYLRIHG